MFLNLEKLSRRSFIKQLSYAVALSCTLSTGASYAGEPEKEELKFGFIKLTDMAPLAIAY